MKTQTYETHITLSNHYPSRISVRRALAFAAIALLLTVCAQISRAQYDPGTDSRVIFWLDADDSSTLFQDEAQTTAATANDHRVGAWQDKSANAWDVSCPAGIGVDVSTGKWKPFLKLNRQNGKPAVRFVVDNTASGQEDWDFLRNTTASFQQDRYTFFVLSRRIRPNDREGLLSLYSSDNGDDSETGGIAAAVIGETHKVGGFEESVADARNAGVLSKLAPPIDGVTYLYCSKYDGSFTRLTRTGSPKVQ